MKPASKLIFILTLLFTSTIAFSQSNSSTNPDDGEFNLFLLSLLTIFFCSMFAAAILGAVIAMFIFLLLFALITIGVLSTSVAIGLYKKSFSAGFKSFLMILLGSGCAVISAIGLFIADYFFQLPISTFAIVIVGLMSGATGGIIMAIAMHRVIRTILKIITQRLKLT